MEKFATLETTSVRISPLRKASKSFSRSLLVVDPWITGASSAVPSSSSWSRYAPITSEGSSGCRPRARGAARPFPRGGRRDPVPLLGFGDGVGHPLLVVEGYPHL